MLKSVIKKVHEPPSFWESGRFHYYIKMKLLQQLKETRNDTISSNTHSQKSKDTR